MVIQSWTVGAGRHCDVVIDAPTVSAEHCRITRRGRTYDVEDLGSTNGTFVNGRPVQFAVDVSRGDALTLGERVPVSWDRLDAADGHPAQQSIAAPQTTQRPPALPRVASLAVVCVLAGMALATWGRSAIRDHERDVSVSIVPTVTTDFEEVDLPNPDIGFAVEPQIRPAVRPAIVPVDVDSEADAEAHAVRESVPGEVPGEVDRSLYVVVAVDRDGKEHQLATAWAASGSLLVTAGAVAECIRRYEDRLDAVLVRDAAGEQFSVTAVSAHPVYSQAQSRCQAISDEVAELKSVRADLAKRVAGREKRGDSERIESELRTIGKRIAELESRKFDAIESAIDCEIALLAVDGCCRHWLAATTSEDRQATDSALMLCGSTIEHGSGASDESAHVAGASVVQHRRPLDDDPTDGYATFECDADQINRVWAGSPVIDSKGRVVAMYVRPTPSAAPGGRTDGDRFDAAGVEQVVELLSAAAE